MRVLNGLVPRWTQLIERDVCFLVSGQTDEGVAYAYVADMRLSLVQESGTKK